MIAVEEFIGDTVYNTGLRIEATPGRIKSNDTRSREQVAQSVKEVNADIVEKQIEGQSK